MFDRDDRPVVATNTQSRANVAALQEERTVRADTGDLGGVSTRMAKNVASASEAETSIWDPRVGKALSERPWIPDEDDGDVHP
jgi:hypothetical protein